MAEPQPLPRRNLGYCRRSLGCAEFILARTRVQPSNPILIHTLGALMQYYIYRIHRYKQAERICWTYNKGEAKHEVNRLLKDNPKAQYEIRLSQ